MANLPSFIVSTLHAEFEDFPWVASKVADDDTPHVDLRVIQVREESDLVVVQLRAQPGWKSELHKHYGMTFGITHRGAWSHDPNSFSYRASSFVSEPVGELHRFRNGPEVTEVTYIIFGHQDLYDEAGQAVTGRVDPPALLEGYYTGCEEQNLARPNVLN
jgi:hypothetical protein